MVNDFIRQVGAVLDNAVYKIFNNQTIAGTEAVISEAIDTSKIRSIIVSTITSDAVTVSLQTSPDGQNWFVDDADKDGVTVDETVQVAFAKTQGAGNTIGQYSRIVVQNANATATTVSVWLELLE